jgi:membrane protease YdiL (CAAX protease family)
MILGKEENRLGVIGFLFAVILMSKTIPSIFEMTIFVPNLDISFGIPLLLKRVFGVYEVPGLLFALGGLLQAFIAILFAKKLTNLSIDFRRVDLWSIVWIATAIVLVAFGRKTFDGLASLFAVNQNAEIFTFPRLNWPEYKDIVLSKFFLEVLLTGLIAPFVEEIIYRGFMTNFFRRYFSIILTGLIVSIIFTLEHYQTIESFGRLITIFLAGLLLYLARIKYDGVATPIIMHIAANSAVVLFVE